ncbi:MAG TPA: long-chain fatty acid--CoA ligase [Mucilaginibacter sp.]|jgi:long-chain acyl-CoA synthetase|nr:long-chain fatty acid--CoA ligase [Mucilaginibacter sp.]
MNTRLFDCIEIQAQAPVPNLLNGKLNGAWVHYSTQQAHERIYGLAAALLDMGVSANDWTTEGRDKIGLISAGRPEWLMTDLAVQLTGAILVPLYPNTGPKELQEILREAGVKYLFVGTKELYDKVGLILSELPDLKRVYTFDQVAGAENWETLLKSFDQADRDKIKSICSRIGEDNISTIIYTSGTTGHPKGVMLTHKNIMSNVKTCAILLRQVPFKEKVALSFLPLNHIFEKMTSYIYLFNGYTIHYAESMDTIGADLKDVKPSIFTSVPRLLEKVFEKIMITGQSLTGIKRKIFFWSIRVAEQFELEDRGLWYNIQLAIADKLVFKKWREALGGNVEIILLGSSATPVRLEKIFTAAGVNVMEGYGLTETSPVIAVNRYKISARRFGTVGPLIDEVEVKIAEDGEILCKGPNIMAGYYKQPQLTAEVITDGWFHTGDVGAFDGPFLKITDRIKEIFKTSGGKYVAPLPIENRMKESPLIEQMMVVGSNRKFTAALIVPSFVNLRSWCATNKINGSSINDLVKDPKVIELFQSIVDKYNPEFNHVEQVKKIALLPGEWSIDGGELTPTGKMKRRVILEKYNGEIEKIYAEANNINPVHI